MSDDKRNADALDPAANQVVDTLIALGYMSEDLQGLHMTEKGYDYMTLFVKHIVSVERKKGMFEVTENYTFKQACKDFTQTLLQRYGSTQMALIGLYMLAGHERLGSA